MFLTLAEVLEIHKDQIDRYGGHPQIRDCNLLRSAVAAPEATWDGEYLNRDIFEMAAAYIFYVCQDHPFIDGNKRTGLAAGLVFLELNKITILDENGVLFDTVMGVASGTLGKAELVAILRELAVSGRGILKSKVPLDVSHVAYKKQEIIEETKDAYMYQIALKRKKDKTLIPLAEVVGDEDFDLNELVDSLDNVELDKD